MAKKLRKAQKKLAARMKAATEAKNIRSKGSTPWGYVDPKTAKAINMPGSMKT